MRGPSGGRSMSRRILGRFGHEDSGSGTEAATHSARSSRPGWGLRESTEMGRARSDPLRSMTADGRSAPTPGSS